MYGGAAGGGKSSAALMCAAQYVHVPGYSALLLRENFPDLNQADALIPRSKEWWKNTDAVYSERDRRWTFPTGATITFGYLDSDDAVYQYQGAAFQLVGIDELTQHTLRRYSYLFSRVRRPKTGPLSEVPLRMRSWTNPGGRGHGWVFNRFVDPKTRRPGAVFVPAKLEDNPSLDRDEYVKSLVHVDPVTRAQLLAGDWTAVEGGRFKAEWFRHRYTRRNDFVRLQRPGEATAREYMLWSMPRYITCDPAASAKTTADWTVALCWAETPLRELVLLDGVRFQAEIPDITPRLYAFWEKWRKPGIVGIEGVASNVAVYQEAKRTGMPAKQLTPSQLAHGDRRDKLVRATPAMVLAESGRIWLPAPGVSPTLPLDAVESELYRFTGDDKTDDHDDIVDCVSYGAYLLQHGNAAAGNAVPHVLGGGMR
jgi:predicted phage terminase large subunit-like protein